MGFIWTPIGKNNYFSGVFDGAGHTITNMHVTTKESNPNYIGLFGALAQATVKNLNMTSAYVYYGEVNYTLMAGIVAGTAINTCFYNCDVEGTLSAIAMDAGGIVGNFTAANDTVFIKDCVNRADIYAVINVGGVVGLSDNEKYNVSIENCANYGMIDGGMCGGIIGDGEGYIVRNCINYGKVGYILNNAVSSGGIAGQGGSFALIEDCINSESGAITGGSAGGIIGAPIDAVIRRCGNRGLVTSIHHNLLFAGGICGSDGSISNCYNIGNVTGIVGNYDGGSLSAEYCAFAGITGSPTTGFVHNVYNAGEIIEATANVNMEWFCNIIPAMLSDTAIRNCYWTKNESLSDKIYNAESSAYEYIPGSSRFSEGAVSTFWILENPQYGSDELLDALNAGAMGEAVWIEDSEGVNGGFPLLQPVTQVGTEEIYVDTEQQVLVYPNPADDMVVLSSVEHQLSVVEIYNVLGMKVDEIEVNAMKIKIDISSYNPGIYLFNIDGKVVKVIKN